MPYSTVHLWVSDAVGTATGVKTFLETIPAAVRADAFSKPHLSGSCLLTASRRRFRLRFRHGVPDPGPASGLGHDAVRKAVRSFCIGPVWVGSDAITSEEHQTLVRDGANVTLFVYPLANATADVVADALATIEEHHPSETVWAQHIQPE
jgi:hypothetical protein